MLLLGSALALGASAAGIASLEGGLRELAWLGFVASLFVTVCATESQE